MTLTVQRPWTGWLPIGIHTAILPYGPPPKQQNRVIPTALAAGDEIHDTPAISSTPNNPRFGRLSTDL